jgi:release factor glutamine methyltransferase
MAQFLGLDVETTKETFIPSPETELLVRACLEAIKRIESPYILDIGTGTGNIAVSLTKADGNCKIVALDESEGALAVAGKNAERFGVSERIEFIQSDLYAALALEPLDSRLYTSMFKRFRFKRFINRFDIIVSNPPYIPTWEIFTLADHVKDEPWTALDGGDDGLDFYKRIIDGAGKFLKKGGRLIMEMGYNQSFDIKKLLEESGSFVDIRTIKDSSKIDRVVEAQYG